MLTSSLARPQLRRLFTGCCRTCPTSLLDACISLSTRHYKSAAVSSMSQHVGVCSARSSKNQFDDAVTKAIRRQCTTQRISSAFAFRYVSSDSNSNSSKEAPDAKAKPPRKVTTLSIAAKKRRGQKITMVTAYDYPSAVHVDRAGIDIVLVGDSCAMVELGFETTQAVKRGAPSRPLLIGDMPFGSYEFKNVDIALQNAYRMVKEGGMDAVKFEGGTEARAKIVRHVVEGGVAVLGHVGLTPQAISVLGGFRAQGRTADRARLVLEEALRLQDAGAFAVVLECIPANVATAITEELDIPTIGIGAGGGTSGQVLVFHDLLGMLSHPHHEEFVPKFCKKYASVGLQINDGLAQFKKEVEDGIFPGEEYSPYSMSNEEEASFDELVSNKGRDQGRDGGRDSQIEETADDTDQLNLYGNQSSKD